MCGGRIGEFKYCMSGSFNFMHSGAGSVPREVILHTQFSQFSPFTPLPGKEARDTSLVLLCGTWLNIRKMTMDHLLAASQALYMYTTACSDTNYKCATKCTHGSPDSVC